MIRLAVVELKVELKAVLLQEVDLLLKLFLTAKIPPLNHQVC